MVLDFGKFKEQQWVASGGNLDFGVFKRERGKYFTGKGYGVSSRIDPYSGRPILKAPLTIPETYNTPEQVLSIESPHRVAVMFDPTIPQKLTRDMVSRSGDRLPEAVSQSIKEELGAAYNEELDHQIALTLSGSNVRENLKNIPKSKNRKIGAMEAQLANDVINGKISLLDAQLQDAKMKGIKLPESKPNLIERIRNKALKLNPEVLESVARIQRDPLGVKETDILKAPKEFLETIWNTDKEAANKIAEYIQTISNPNTSNSKKIGKFLEASAAFGGAVFSPFAALFKAGEQVPLLKGVANLFGMAAAFLGEGGKVIIDKMVIDGILSGLPEKDKENIRKGAEEIGSLVAQIGGFKTMDVVGAKLAPKASEALTKLTPSGRQALRLKTDMKAKAPDLSKNIDQVPNKTINKFAKEHGEEGAKAMLTTAVDVADQISKGEITPKDVKAMSEAAKFGNVNKINEALKQAKPETRLPPKKVPETPTTAPSKMGKSIAAKAVEDKLIKDVGKTAQYERINIKQDAQAATNLVNSDIKTARAVVRGEIAVPNTIKNPVSLIIAMERYARENPKSAGDIIGELANSPLVSETSVAGQTLRLARERNPNNPLTRLSEVKEYRQKKAKAATKETKSSIKKKLTEAVKVKGEDFTLEEVYKFIKDNIC